MRCAPSLKYFSMVFIKLVQDGFHFPALAASGSTPPRKGLRPGGQNLRLGKEGLREGDKIDSIPQLFIRHLTFAIPKAIIIQ
jgi:hypothetical protein